ncbi:phosphotransferase [bacterium]|nr:phosphotransferase [bacterium]
MTPQNFETIEQVSQAFNLGEIRSQYEIQGSNRSIIFQTDTGKFHLKSYTKNKTTQTIKREIDFTNSLSEHSFNVPKHLSLEPFLFQNILTTLTTYIEKDSSLSVWDNMVMFGELLGRIHLKSEQYSYKGEIEQRTSYRSKVEENITQIEALLGISKDVIMQLLNGYEKIRERKRTTDKELPCALIHGELNPSHVLPYKGTFGIIDFEGIKYAPLILDFGPFLLTHTYTSNQFDTKLVQEFFEGYAKFHMLSNNEKELIQQELEYNYLHKIEWRMTAMFNNPDYVKVVKNDIENYEQFKKELIKIDEILAKA